MDTIQTSKPAPRGWGGRYLGAAVLDGRVYADAADDPSSTALGAAIVLLAGVSQGLALAAGAGDAGLVLGMVTVLAGWPLWAAMIHVAAGERGTWTRLLRVLGLAHVPAILTVLAAESPGRVAMLVIWAWSLAAAVVGVQAALRCSRRKAVIVTGLTWSALMLAATWAGDAIAQAMIAGEYLRSY